MTRVEEMVASRPERSARSTSKTLGYHHSKSALKSQGYALNALDIEPSETSKWDPGLTERVMAWIRPLIKGYHRAEVRGLESFPPGGALVVSNHSGGLFAMDVPVFATG